MMQGENSGVEAWWRETAATIAGAGFARRRGLLQVLDARLPLYRIDHEPRWVLEAWLSVHADRADEPNWRRETMRANDDDLPRGPVQMKVCIFQGWEDDNNPEIIATFYTDPQGNVHVDNEAFYDTVRGIVSSATGRRTDGHDGIAFLHAVRAYFPGPHIWAGEVVPLYPGMTNDE